MNRAIVASVVVLAACGSSREVQLLVPEDIELHWDEAFNGNDDGLGALVPVDVMVYDAATGEPLEDVPLGIAAATPGVTLLSSEGAVAVDPDECYGCDVLWDAWRDRYVEVVADEVGLRTGADGVLRLTVLVDSFPLGDDAVGDSFLPVPVVVSLDGQDTSFLLVPR